MFIDGENLAIRYGRILSDRGLRAPDHVAFRPNTFAWSPYANIRKDENVNIIRKYYYTSVAGDEHARRQVQDELKSVGIEVPRVFHQSKRKGSKRVDITLATDMLSHAFRGNFDTAILVAGDEDYVPLVETVMSEGKRVALWFFEEGMSQALGTTVDYCFNISGWFLPSAKDAEDEQRSSEE